MLRRVLFGIYLISFILETRACKKQTSVSDMGVQMSVYVHLLSNVNNIQSLDSLPPVGKCSVCSISSMNVLPEECPGQLTYALL